MMKKVSLLVVEVLLEVCLLFLVTILVCLCVELIRNFIFSIVEEFDWKFMITFISLFAVGSLTVRLVMMEIPLKFFIRRNCAKVEKFSIYKMSKIIVFIHTPLYIIGAFMFYGFQGKLDNDGAVLFSLVVYLISISCALLAPILIYKIWGELFDTCFDKNFQRTHGLSYYFERKGYLSKIEPKSVEETITKQQEPNIQ